MMDTTYTRLGTPHEGLAVTFTRRYRWALSASLTMDDLLQDARLAIFETEQAGDVEKHGGVAAGYAIQNAAYKAVHRLSRPVAIKRSVPGRRLMRAGYGLRVQLDGYPPEAKQSAASEDQDRKRQAILESAGANTREDPMCTPDALADAWDALPERWREVVFRSVVEDEPLADIAREYGVTRQRVSQVQAKALARLREALDGPA